MPIGEKIIVGEEARRLAARPYTMVIQREIDDDSRVFYIGCHPALPGCKTEASTSKRAEENLDELREEWIQVFLDEGLDVPAPDKETMRVVINMSAEEKQALKAEFVAAVPSDYRPEIYGVGSIEAEYLELMQKVFQALDFAVTHQYCPSDVYAARNLCKAHLEKHKQVPPPECPGCLAVECPALDPDKTVDCAWDSPMVSSTYWLRHRAGLG